MEPFRAKQTRARQGLAQPARTAVLPIWMLVVSAACTSPVTLKPYLQARDRPLHISHRGGAAVFPENTLLAYEQSLYQYDTDVIEIDVHRTRDGVLVVMHDEEVDRTTNGHGRIRDLDYATVRRLDAGFRFSPDGGESHPYRDRGLWVPTLVEVFQAFPEALSNVEVKQLDPPIEDELARLVREMGMLNKVCLGSFAETSAARLRELLPQACHYASEDQALQFFLASRVGVAGLMTLEVDAFALPPTQAGLTVIDDCLLAAAADHHVAVWAWTINQEPEMRRLLDLGVDGIMSDRPDLLAEVMRAKGLR